MRPELERIKQRIRSGDISQDVLKDLASAIPSDSNFEEIMHDAPIELDSFREVADRLQKVKKHAVDAIADEERWIRFIDYDGTIIETIELSELPLKALPTLPDHSNDFIPITFTGWTSTLEQVNSAKNSLDVGAQYKSTDGDTHLAVHVSEVNLDENENGITLEIMPISESILVDFGDGHTATIPAYVPNGNDSPETVSVTNEYMNAGDFDIRISTEAQNYELIVKLTTSTKVFGIVIGDGVQSIGANTFTDCYSMRWIVIPDGVQKIGDKNDVSSGSFYHCMSLKGLVIPNSVLEIGRGVFSAGSSLQNLVIGNSVRTFSEYAFYTITSLHNLVFPDSVEVIGDSCFTNCNSLKNLVLGSNIKDYGDYALEYCYDLQSLFMPSAQTMGYGVFQYVYALKKLVIGDDAQLVGNNAFYYCYSLNDLVIGDGVQTISNNAFYQCYSLNNLLIGNAVQQIGDYSFWDCRSLESLVIPHSVQSIGGYAFAYCYSLRNLIISEGVTTLGSNVFYSCRSLQNLVIPDSVQGLSYSSFYYCHSLKNLVLGSGIQSIGSSSFYQSYSLENLTIKDGVQSIGSSNFNSCYSLRSLVIPDSVQTIEGSAFSSCNSLESLVLGNGLTMINSYAFSSPYSLKSLVIPDSVQKLYSSVFYTCFSLESLVIGKNVNSIDSYSFYTSDSLRKIYIRQEDNSLSLPSGLNNHESDIEWNYGMHLVGFNITNKLIAVGVDPLIEIKYIYKYDLEDGDKELDKGYELSCSDNATLSDGVLHPLSDSGTVVVTATSTDDPTYSVSKELEIIQEGVLIDLNDGQWVDSGEDIDGNTVYKSDAGSHDIRDGKSVCTIDVVGYTTLNIWAKSDNGWYTYYNYIVLGEPNSTVSRSTYRSAVTNTSYTKYTYDFSSPYNSVQIMYTKSGNSTDGTDRGYFYFTVE